MVVAVAVLSAGLTWLVHAHSSSASNACVQNLRQIMGVKEQWGAENHMTSNDAPTWDDLAPLLPHETKPRCPAGGTYTIGRLGTPPECTIGGRDHSL